MSKKRNNITSETATILNKTEDTNVETVKETQTENVETTIESSVVEDTYKPVDESPVVEETQDTVVESVDEIPVVETVVEETVTDKDIEEVVDESLNTIDSVVGDEKKVVEMEVKPVHVDDPTIVTETTKPEKVENDENINPVTEKVSGKQEISGEKDKIQIELCKKYKCKFAQSYFMKICATSREFSLFSMIETYLMNKTAYIGLTSLEDFNHIKDVMENNNISFKYKILDPYVKKQFLQKLEFNTQYAVSHK